MHHGSTPNAKLPCHTKTHMLYARFTMTIYKMTTPGAFLPSAKHFQTTAERRYRAYFSSGHIN